MTLVGYKPRGPMQPYTHYVGIDVSKHTLDVMLYDRRTRLPKKAVFEASNDFKGHGRVIQWLDGHEAPRRPSCAWSTRAVMTMRCWNT